jgi:hypothetical protein
MVCLSSQSSFADVFTCNNRDLSTCPGFGAQGLAIAIPETATESGLVSLDTMVTSGDVVFCDTLIAGTCPDPSNQSDVLIFPPDPADPTKSRFAIFLSDPVNTDLPVTCGDMVAAPCTVFFQEPFGSFLVEPPAEIDNVALIWKSGTNTYMASSDPAPIPESSTIMLVLSGLMGVARGWREKHKQ